MKNCTNGKKNSSFKNNFYFLQTNCQSGKKNVTLHHDCDKTFASPRLLTKVCLLCETTKIKF
jgi:hypothetical protein